MESDVASSSIAPAAAPQRVVGPPTVPLRVVVVVDDAIICALLAELLQAMGYDVCAVAATADEAVARAAQHHPGLMIVDLQLRTGDGIEAMERILKAGPMPCVFITGAPPRFGRVTAGVLHKPVHENELREAIQHILGATPASRPGGSNECG